MASRSTSSDEDNRDDSTPDAQTDVPTTIIDQPNRWCVKGQYQIYTNDKMHNDNGIMTQTLTLELQILMASLPTMTSIHELFTRNWLELMARDVGRYSEEMVREFYASYV